MALGLYIHIPYCIQKCHYCDFATLPEDSQANYIKYVDALKQEVSARAPHISDKQLKSLYFGGGTPSLLPAENILSLRESIANAGFEFCADAEVTIEANPGTLTANKLDLYRGAGINRLSIGAQTFQDEILKKLGREHNAAATHETLHLAKNAGFKISVDLMFGLPGQNINVLESDLSAVLSYQPEHVSVYNLTIPPQHSLNVGRPLDEEQAEMFNAIEDRLRRGGIHRYEISNFSTPGHESKHNTIYWTGQSYWGLGMSSHSYFADQGAFGTRLWNPRILQKYFNQVDNKHTEDMPFWNSLPKNQVEVLRPHEFLTDFFHTRLRRVVGFSKDDFFSAYKSAAELWPKVHGRIESLAEKKLISLKDGRYFLTSAGYALANRVFFELTFLAEDLL